MEGRLTNASHVEKVLRFLYVPVNPYNYMVEKPENVPDLLYEARLYFQIGMALEILLCLLKEKPTLNVYYAFSNVSAGMISETSKLIIRPFHYLLYTWLYQNYCIYELPWDSPWTFYVALILADLGYYWIHRAGHEVNIFWAAHQAHHSSEDYNLSTALRQGMLQTTMTSWITTPIALFVPPAVFLVHWQFNMIYQFWIHTECVESLGPFEYVFNTPSHHRVHHGRNPYCIDKNYGGTLIIWDRLFGTFAQEDEKVAYGLVHQQDTSDPTWIQLGHYIELIKRSLQMETIHDKISVLLRGPGWMAETEKAGLTEAEMSIPEVEQPITQRNLVGKNYSLTFYIYMVSHFLVVLQLFDGVSVNNKLMSVVERYFWMIFLFLSLTSLGYFLDKKPKSYHLELSRCLIFMFADHLLGFSSVQVPGFNDLLPNVVRFVFGLSSIFMAYFIFNGIPRGEIDKKNQ